MYDAHRLRLLVELDRRGTIAQVAHALSYSPSTISQQLSTLEREAGCVLFTPAGRRLQLTPQARVLVTYASQILALMDEAAAAVEASGTRVAGTVRLAVFQSASQAMVPLALSDLAEQYPDLRVEVTELDPEAALLRVVARDFDVVLAEQYPGHTRPILAELDRIPLAQDRIRLATAPGSIHARTASPGGTGVGRTDTNGTVQNAIELNAVAPTAVTSSAGGLNAGDLNGVEFNTAELRDVEPLTLQDLRDMPWVMEPVGTASRQWALQTCRQAGFEPDVRFETADLFAQVQLIRNGNAVGLLPDLVWAGAAPEVDLTDLPYSPEREIFSSARLATAARPGVVAVRSALRRAADALVVI